MVIEEGIYLDEPPETIRDAINRAEKKDLIG